jgi:type IV pilus assembly protein PilQ
MKAAELLAGVYRVIRLMVLVCTGHAAVMPAGAAEFSLSLEPAPLTMVLELLAREHDLFLQAYDIEEELMVSLDVQQADLATVLAELLHQFGYDFRVQGRFLHVGESLKLLQVDEQSRQRSELLEPLLTRFMQVNYADAGTLLALIQSGSDEGILSARGSAMLDVRTNTLIVRDIAARLRDVEILITELDVPVSQVLIEARIVNASLETGRELGVRWGLSLGSAHDVSAQMSGDELQLQVDNRGVSQLRIGALRTAQLLEWELAMLESQGQAELMARPTVITQDNSPASIRSGVRIPYQAQAGGTAGGSITQFVDAVLALDVTPKVTPDGRIILNLHLRQDSVASGSGDVPAINTNTVETRVLIDNMNTLVLGGIFREEQTRQESGTPVLKDLPWLGGLFRRSVTASRRTELLIFITPQIIPAY